MQTLQDFLSDISYELLPPAWTASDLATFSRNKRLFDYQQTAVEFAVRGLWKYYEDCADYIPGEPIEVNTERKEHLFNWYRANGIDENLDIPVDRHRRDIQDLLMDKYPVHNGTISYMHFINRMSFWMATGSGKTLVIIKLLELLWRLGQSGEIPQNNLLVLTHRDDLIKQFRTTWMSSMPIANSILT